MYILYPDIQVIISPVTPFVFTPDICICIPLLYFWVWTRSYSHFRTRSARQAGEKERKRKENNEGRCEDIILFTYIFFKKIYLFWVAGHIKQQVPDAVNVTVLPWGGECKVSSGCLLQNGSCVSGQWAVLTHECEHCTDCAQRLAGSLSLAKIWSHSACNTAHLTLFFFFPEIQEIYKVNHRLSENQKKKKKPWALIWMIIVFNRKLMFLYLDTDHLLMPGLKLAYSWCISWNRYTLRPTSVFIASEWLTTV